MDIGRQKRVIMVEPVEVPERAPEPAVEPQPVAEPVGEWPLPYTETPCAEAPFEIQPEPVR